MKQMKGKEKLEEKKILKEILKQLNVRDRRR